MTAVLGVALVVPMAEQTALFPYNYVYVNPIAGIGGVEGRWETDYWWASFPEALERVPADEDLLCGFEMAPADDPSSEGLQLPCLGDEFEPFGDRRGQDVSSTSEAKPPARWVIGRNRGGRVPPAACEEADDVTRWLRGERLVMSYVLRC